MQLLKDIQKLKTHKKKAWAALIDPDKWPHQKSFLEYLKKINDLNPNYIFLGGSTVQAEDFKNIAYLIKAYSSIPLIIFPGSSLQISDHADAILFLSLISGRNPDYLIHHHVLAAPKLSKMEIEVIPTSYLLVDGHSQSSVAYVSQTTPIPREQNSIALHTAQAGALMGHHLTYLDAGSGATKSVPNSMITTISTNINNPIIVGGGLTSREEIISKFNAGADVVVIGNALEKDSSMFRTLASLYHN